MAFYHIYRPQNFEDMRLTQPEVTTYFEKVLSANKLGHIYLLVGSHGIGKTSTARILARAANCLGKKTIPCNTCENCKAILDGAFVDVYELDAASHRGIDDIRALQEIIRLSPVVGRKKVYIIDEVHMLTTEAFNALLKTFEEPPESRLFLLCTTELHKVPQTIQSRATVITFNKPSDQIVAEYITRIVTLEGGTIDQESALAVARGAEGAFRDAAKLAEQLLLQSKKIEIDHVLQLFGLRISPSTLVDVVRSGSVEGLQKIVEQLEQHGANIGYFIRACVTHVRHEMHQAVLKGTSIGFEIGLLRALQQALADLRYAPLPALTLELALFELVLSQTQHNVVPETVRAQTVGRVIDVEQAPVPIIKHTRTEVSQQKEVSVKKHVKEELVQVHHEESMVTVHKPVVTESEEVPEFEKIRERWREVVALVKDSNASVASVLRLSPPQAMSGNSLVVSTTYRFHKDRLEATKNRQLVEGALFELFGVPMRLDCQLIQQSTKKKDVENVHAVSDEGLVEAAMEIFAG